MRHIKVAEALNSVADYGGNLISSLNEVEAAAKRDGTPLEMIYIIPNSRPELEWIKDLQRNHKVYLIPEAPFWTVAKEMYGICRKEKVDVLHTHFYQPFVPALTGALTKTKVVAHFHNTFAATDSRVKNMVMKTFRLLSPALDRCVGCSEEVYNSLLENRWPVNKCGYVTNRIDFSRLDASKDNEPFDATKNNVLILGTHFIRKGCDLALKAIEPIAEEFNIVLQIVCHNVEQCSTEIVQTLGDVPAWVKFPPTTECIGDYFRNSQIFLSPSREEGFCTAVLEAAYCNCPVIKSDIVQMVHGMENEDFIRVPLTAEALRDKIVEILEMDSVSRGAMLESFRQQAIEKYDVSIWGNEVLQIYKDVLR